jgi:hypothetical protein
MGMGVEGEGSTTGRVCVCVSTAIDSLNYPVELGQRVLQTQVRVQLRSGNNFIEKFRAENEEVALTRRALYLIREKRPVALVRSELHRSLRRLRENRRQNTSIHTDSGTW